MYVISKFQNQFVKKARTISIPKPYWSLDGGFNYKMREMWPLNCYTRYYGPLFK